MAIYHLFLVALLYTYKQRIFQNSTLCLFELPEFYWNLYGANSGVIKLHAVLVFKTLTFHS